ncbi:hypothetical protein BDP81DRAFT_444753 [Colletotrichum phormii]|uniref:Uncharacterized protein n=1 Tax=Colletotrichum phormii TaxID=359342 RepID=A0AAJ0A476_9PEZI|nr:uncharacterized protein BDP81DRAFT_444753 [Colletotrichum phormii]KAK1656180.1 hypothetical protein BDP81DRAFT_444753 [Colletotrichum phormii]
MPLQYAVIHSQYMYEYGAEKVSPYAPCIHRPVDRTFCLPGYCSPTACSLPSKVTESSRASAKFVEDMEGQSGRLPQYRYEAEPGSLRRESYHSFGDEGLTATVGSSGRLLEMSQYVPEQPRGFRVDENGMEEPCWVVSRLSQLLSRASNPRFTGGIGPRIDAGTPLQEPRLVNAVTERSTAKTPPRLTIAGDLLIRDLDYDEEESNDRNFSSQFDSGYEQPRLIHGCIVQSRQMSDGKSYEASEIVRKGGRLTVTIAYRLGLIMDKQDRQPSSPSDLSMLSTEAYSEAMSLFEIQFEEQTFTADADVNFRLRRNLEHVLSVCSVPVSSADELNTCAIALTCGDVDNHRITASASLHFQSHHETNPACVCEKKVASKLEGTYTCIMIRGIERVCKGHIKWVFECAKKTGKPFGSNYWLNGDRRSTRYRVNGRDTLRRSLADTPFQIIKPRDFYMAYGETSLGKLLKAIRELP